VVTDHEFEVPLDYADPRGARITVVYHDDMYVDAACSMETARAIAGLRVWITNEYEHDGSRRDGERVLGRPARPGPRRAVAASPAGTAPGSAV